ncbi:F-box protein-like [Rhynchospora pubera]|uniref:F-box protein-like n=1 Tax=Rhynchospora pubera TaxID=906938 RepID=A0AAV8FRI1_9POAL|nr:F-box protein-like [Rhynchospora pubera]
MAVNIQDLHPDILTCALRRLDGPSLAAVGCTSSLLRSLSSDPSIWRDLCLSSWPSLGNPQLLSFFPTSQYQSLFSSIFPFPCHSTRSQSSKPLSLTRNLISAVDLHHRGNLIFSKVIEVDTSSSWFLGSPFGVGALEGQSSQLVSLIGEISLSELNLSWILIDPESKKAVNISSRRPVAIDRHWYTGETLVRYGMVIRDLLISVVVTCGEDCGQVKEISMTIEDEDGIGVCGKESLEMLMEAMEGTRIWKSNGEEELEASRRYDEFIKRRRSRKESKARKECLVDLCCTGVSAVVFVSIFMLVAFK